MPLLARGTVIGTLGMVTPVGRILTAHEVEFLITLGREIGIAIDNARLLANTQQSEQQAIALYELGAKISASLALDSAIDAVAGGGDQAFELLAPGATLLGAATAGMLCITQTATRTFIEGDVTGDGVEEAFQRLARATLAAKEARQ